jgi:hypothetical protein
VSDTDTLNIDLLRVIPLESEDPDKETVRKITTLSAEAQKRNYPQFIVKLSARREGMQLGNALKIAAGKA